MPAVPTLNSGTRSTAGYSSAAKPSKLMPQRLPCLRLETDRAIQSKKDEFEAHTYFSHGVFKADGSLETVSRRIKPHDRFHLSPHTANGFPRTQPRARIRFWTSSCAFRVFARVSGNGQFRACEVSIRRSEMMRGN